MPSISKTGSRGRAPLARYSNYFEIGHNPYEFLVDFGQYQPETAEVVLHTRIAVGPSLAKLLHDMLSDAVLQYEAEHGPIQIVTGSPDPLQVLLQSLPDFERRARHARECPLSDTTTPSKRTLRKR